MDIASFAGLMKERIDDPDRIWRNLPFRWSNCLFYACILACLASECQHFRVVHPIHASDVSPQRGEGTLATHPAHRLMIQRFLQPLLGRAVVLQCVEPVQNARGK